MKLANPPMMTDVERYLDEAPVEEYAADRFRRLPRDLQLQVMNKRRILHCRDPTMLLLGLIAAASKVEDKAPVASASAKGEEAEDKSDDEMDAVLKQIREEEKSKKGKKTKKTEV